MHWRYERLYYYEQLLIHKFIDLLRSWLGSIVLLLLLQVFSKRFAVVGSFLSVSFSFGVIFSFSHRLEWIEPFEMRYIASCTRPQRSLTTNRIIFSTLVEMKLLAVVVCNYGHVMPPSQENMRPTNCHSFASVLYENYAFALRIAWCCVCLRRAKERIKCLMPNGPKIGWKCAKWYLWDWYLGKSTKLKLLLNVKCISTFSHHAKKHRNPIKSF